MTHQTHSAHSHVHGSGCGHLAIRHGAHLDYAHDGHLHHTHDGHTDECALEVDAVHPAACTPSHACAGHDAQHTHGASCGHPAVPHGDHVDFIVNGHLHHPHGGHCDDHGAVDVS